MTRQLDAGICHDPFASLCHFPLSKFNIVLQKIRSHESWATRQLSWDPGHFGTSKQCRWFALVQASGEKWSSRNRNFWNLQKIEVQFASHGRWYQPSSSSCGNLQNHFCLRCRWGVWEGQLLFFSADISLTYCRKVGEFPGSYVWSEDPKNCSLIYKWKQKRNDSLIYFEASHPNGENRTWRVLNAEAMGFHCHLTLHVGWFSNKTEFITSTFPVSMPRGMGWKHWETDDKIHGLPAWTRGARPWAHGKMVFPELLRHLHGVTWSVASLTLLFADGDDGNAVVWYFDHAFEI